MARQGPTNYHGSYHLLRINQGRNFRPRGHTQFVWVRDLVGPVGMRWRGAGSAFAASAWQLARPLDAWWGARPADPWGVRTDLPPDDCAAQWDARRGGCDPCFNGPRDDGPDLPDLRPILGVRAPAAPDDGPVSAALALAAGAADPGPAAADTSPRGARTLAGYS